jgi:diguanylate cyclase (GGDEF)-like protein/PAS domain S-box-containing protein
MGKSVFSPHSLKTRLILGSLVIFLASLWSLSLYASWTLRADMKRLLGEQQYSTVLLVADRVDYEFTDRIGWLTEVARQAEKAMRRNPRSVQSELDGWESLFAKFNGGIFATAADGVAIAAVPHSSRRVGVSYRDRSYMIAALEEGRVAISEPLMGRTSRTPVIVVAVPLRGERGEVIGVLNGVINMAEPNFLDYATQNHHSSTGGFLLLVPQQKMIATATDKTHVMEVVSPAAGTLLDRFLKGYQGYGVTIDPRGTEMLAAARTIPATGWSVVGYLPTAEAFAPIREMERRMLVATLVLTVLAGLLSWWLLKRQLSPLRIAARSLAEMSDAPESARPLAVMRDDEIGQLIGGFNRLLDTLWQREALLKQILDTSNVAIFLVDKTWRITRANQHTAEMFGYPADVLHGGEFISLVPTGEREDWRQRLGGIAAGDGVLEADRMFCRADGSRFWGHLTARHFLDAQGVELGVVCVISDITQRKEAEDRNKLAASVFSHTREGITITSPDGTIVDVNEAFTRITGYAREEVIGKNPRLIKSDHHPPEFYAAMWHDLLGKGFWSGEIWNRRKNGELYPELLTISAVRDAQGSLLHYVALFTDITPMKDHEEQLRHLAHFDRLTRLPNRVLLGDRLHQAMTQTQRRKQLLTVVYLDLDGFKAVNDIHGHSVGDQLLVALAGRMQQVLRDSDTLARLGGDEFVAVLIDLDDMSATPPMLNRLLSAAAQPVRIGELLLQVSASLGVTFYPQSEEVDADQLLRQADQAMYQAKLAGKNRYHIFDADQDRNLRGRHESLEHIRRALAEGEFVLFYQPKVNMRTGKIVGAESLIRWRHPENGLLSPGVFLPVIENHPLGVQVGEWVIERALEQSERWQGAGLTIPVSVNVCARLLQQDDFPERLQQLLARHPAVSPGHLTLEVLETSALEDLAGVSRIIEECRSLGVRFALDDFGTGYSSLTYLKRLSVDQLKIDQSFVRDMLDDPDDLAILEGVISLAEAFRREVIAEGVETPAHGEMLLLLGCELAQGYGIARPMPEGELSGWAADWRHDPQWSLLRPLGKDDLPLLFAGTEHRAWIAGIDKYLVDDAGFPARLGADECRFGSWLANEGQASYAERPLFPEIRRLHGEVHVLAKVLCERKQMGNTGQLEDGRAELRALSDALLAGIRALVLECASEEARRGVGVAS